MSPTVDLHVRSKYEQGYFADDSVATTANFSLSSISHAVEAVLVKADSCMRFID